MSRRAIVLMVTTLAILATGSFYLRVLARRIFESPQHGEAAARTRLREAALQPVTSANQTATLYFPSYSEGKVVAESRPIAWAASDTDRVRQVMLALIEGSRPGQNRTLPASTVVRAVFLSADGTAYIDLSNDGLADFAPGIETESLAVYSIVNSLASNIPSVKHVKFLIQGQEVDTLNGHADLSGVFVPAPSRLTLYP